MIKSVVALFSKGVVYGKTKVYNLYEYIIVGHDGQVVPAISTDGGEPVAQGGKENNS
jgi:hypothetical protein